MRQREETPTKHTHTHPRCANQTAEPTVKPSAASLATADAHVVRTGGTHHVQEYYMSDMRTSLGTTGVLMVLCVLVLACDSRPSACHTCFSAMPRHCERATDSRHLGRTPSAPVHFAVTHAHRWRRGRCRPGLGGKPRGAQGQQGSMGSSSWYTPLWQYQQMPRVRPAHRQEDGWRKQSSGKAGSWNGRLAW